MDKPITMEAVDRATADKMLVQLSINSKVRMKVNDLIDVRIETPLFGISTKTRKGEEYVWVGKENTSDGWLLQSEYDAIENLKQQQ